MTNMAMNAVETAESPAARAREARDGLYRRRGMKAVLWTILPGIIIIGYFVPALGFSLLACMGAAVGVGFWRGRAWCDVCPRGAFLDVIMGGKGGKRSIPQWLRSTPMRVTVLTLVMGMMGTRLAAVWGDVAAMGLVFVTLLTVTTMVGIAMALFLNPRSWCTICPMGSLAAWVGKRKQPLQVDKGACVSCGACAKACPMELRPEAHREAGQMCEGDCLKCSACVVACPKQALSWAERRAA